MERDGVMVTVLVVTVIVVTVLMMVMVLVVTVQLVTVLIVSNKWMQVLPVQCKMERSVSTLAVTSNLILNAQASFVNLPLYSIYLG